MLNYLRIRNLALIEDVAIEPQPGLVVFTGETGAGKSILLDGLALLAGQRASLDRLRHDSDKAVVEGAFDTSKSAALRQALEAEGFAEEDDGLVVRRTIAATGSRAYVNGHLVSIGSLRQLGAMLVEVVGQHDSQALLRAPLQLGMLDSYGGLGPQVEAVTTAYVTAAQLHARLEALRIDARERAQRADYLRFQVEEIGAAGLSPQEEQELASTRQRFRHAEELSVAATEALELLYESEGSAMERVGQAQQRVASIERLDPSAGLAPAALDEVRFAVEELARTLQPYRDSIQADPARLAQIEQRLAEIDAMRRKYGDSVEEVLERAAAAASELSSLENRDQEIEGLSEQLGDALGAYDTAATALTAARELAAAELQQRITQELQELGMQGARFSVRLRPGGGDSDIGLPPGASRNGYESVDFLLAANPGEPAQPLARVASGGELSRVLLALKLAQVQAGPRQTLVFDEVDAGVGGGGVADCLADRLGRLGAMQQVLVVTHLPQIAARATTHFHVSKLEDGGRVAVRVSLLGTEARVDELARMLGGVQITDSVREHAKDLLGGRG